MPEVSADFRSGRCGCSAASTSPTTRRSRASRASSSPPTTCTRSSASTTRRYKSPAYTLARRGRHPRPGGAARHARCATRSRSTTTASVEGLRALDRYTLQFKLAKPRPRFATTLAATDRLRRGGARGRRVLSATTSMAHPVGTGPFRLKSLAPQLAHRAGAEPELPRRALTTSEPAADDAEGAGVGQALQRPAPAAERRRRDRRRRGKPAALAGFLNGQADFARVPPEFSPLAAPNGKLAPNLAKRGIRLQRYLQPGRRAVVLQHGGPGGRRLHAGEGRAAPRGPAWRTTSTTRSGSSGAARRSPAQAPMPPGTYGLRPGLREREQRLRPGAREGAARHLRLRRPRRRRLARAARRLAARLTMASEPEQIYRQYNENWQRSIGSDRRSHGLRNRAVGRAHEGRRAPASCRCGSSAATATIPTARARSSTCTASRSARPTCARFKLPAFDDIYRRMLDLPDGPERLAAVPQGERAGRRLHAVPHPRAPHLQRLLAPLDRRLPAAVLPQPVLALRRGRRRDARQGARPERTAPWLLPEPQHPRATCAGCARRAASTSTDDYEGYDASGAGRCDRPGAFWQIDLGLLRRRVADAARDACWSRRRCRARVWFPGAQVNYAQQVFRHADAAHAAGHPAIVFRDEAMQRARRTQEIALARAAPPGRVARGRARGDGRRSRGDRVAAYLPNMPEAAVAFLACASIGAVWSMCSPDMGPLAVLDRFRQIEPKVLIACDGYRYGGVAHRPRGACCAECVAELPSVRDVVLCAQPRRAADAASLALGSAPRARLRRADRRRRAASRRAGCRSTIRCGSSIRAAPPACRSRSCTAMAASCSRR